MAHAKMGARELRLLEMREARFDRNQKAAKELSKDELQTKIDGIKPKPKKAKKAKRK